MSFRVCRFKENGSPKFCIWRNIIFDAIYSYDFYHNDWIRAYYDKNREKSFVDYVSQGLYIRPLVLRCVV